MRNDGDNGGSSSMPAAASVLAGSGTSDLATSPFCHLATHNALPPDYYDTLQKLFPDDQAILHGRADEMGNAAARLTSVEIVDNPAIAPAWREFVAFHTSDAFWADLVRVFGTALRQAHPDAERQAGRKFEDWRTTRRGDATDLEVRLECQFVINTPTNSSQAPSSVKTPHVDKRNTLFAALLYFRDDADASSGGDLELYGWTRPPRFVNRKRMILPYDVSRERTIPYAPNTFIAFVNTPYAVHGVSPRSATPVARRYINFIAEVPFNLFELQRIGFVDRLRHRRQVALVGSRKIPGDQY